jgi:steroid delta-isomerase
MPTPDQLRDLITGYVAAINARDAAGVGALFAEDARQADPASNPPNIGRAAITAFFESSITGSDSWTFAAKSLHTCASIAAIDFEIDVVAGGTTMHIEGIEVFEVGEDGLFTSANAYWDDADMTFV